MQRFLFPNIKREINNLSMGARRPGSSFLLWFLINVYRIDSDDAPDIVCDSVNDKGIDGILVDDQSSEVIIFSSKYYTGSRTKSQGDAAIRNLVGASNWFSSPETIQSLLESTGSEELKSLVSRLDIARKIEEGYRVHLAFITSVPFDNEAKEYISLQENTGITISGWDSVRINESLLLLTEQDRISGSFNLTIIEGGFFDQTLTDGTRVVILPIRATEIALLGGIEDNSLFASNVRLPIGSTRVNRDIRAAIQTSNDHERFLLYHNGITMLCDSMEVNSEKLIITNYSVVNGCQSVASFYDNRDYLTENLLVLTKIVQVSSIEKSLAEEITYRSNNQNPTNMRDQRSNDRVQTQLQYEFNEKYSPNIFYIRKRGEQTPKGAERLENDLVGQIILSFEVMKPESSHQKWRIFDEFYSEIFSRHVTAEKIYFTYKIYRGIERCLVDVSDELVRHYSLTKFFFLYLVRCVLDRDEIGKKLVQNPNTAMANYEDITIHAIEQLIRMLIRPFNQQITSMNAEGYFDYKSDFKSKEQIRILADKIINMYEISLVLHPEGSPKALLTQNGEIIPAQLFGK